MRLKLPEMEREQIFNASQKELFLDRSKDALDYLIQVRGFDEKTIRKFALGFMPEGVKNSEGQIHELAGRIIIPLKDSYGNLVALSSRRWNETDKKTFWHESYAKSHFLFGLDLAKKDITKSRKAILVEGEFDVMKLHQAGINCTVGICGSAPQLFQIALLRRYCKEMFLVFDSDQAGDNATARIMKEKIVQYFSQSFFDTYLIPVKLPRGTDPDDFIKDRGAKEFIRLLRETKNNYYKDRK